MMINTKEQKYKKYHVDSLSEARNSRMDKQWVEPQNLDE